jgi:hypothetical protein
MLTFILSYLVIGISVSITMRIYMIIEKIKESIDWAFYVAIIVIWPLFLTLLLKEIIYGRNS